MAKVTIKVSADPKELQCIFGASLRYGLGRKTYMTSLIPEVISDNLALFDKNFLGVLIEDIELYEKDRVAFGPNYDHECDYENWLKLKKTLKNEHMSRQD